MSPCDGLCSWGWPVSMPPQEEASQRTAVLCLGTHREDFHCSFKDKETEIQQIGRSHKGTESELVQHPPAWNQGRTSEAFSFRKKQGGLEHRDKLPQEVSAHLGLLQVSVSGTSSQCVPGQDTPPLWVRGPSECRERLISRKCAHTCGYSVSFFIYNVRVVLQRSHQCVYFL